MYHNQKVLSSLFELYALCFDVGHAKKVSTDNVGIWRKANVNALFRCVKLLDVRNELLLISYLSTSLVNSFMYKARQSKNAPSPIAQSSSVNSKRELSAI